MAKWRCDACGEAENTDIKCVLDIDIGEPQFCPISNDEAEWHTVEDKDNG
jgi:hypothetical protein